MMEIKNNLKHILENHLKGGEAFMPLNEILGRISFEKTGERPKELPYSFYELFYHMYATQKDILDYCLQKNYTEKEWPGEYWPKQKQPKDSEEWKALKKAFFEDQQKLIELMETSELNDTVPSNPKHSFFREMLLVIEHNAYHSGQLLIILRHLGLHS